MCWGPGARWGLWHALVGSGTLGAWRALAGPGARGALAHAGAWRALGGSGFP